MSDEVNKNVFILKIKTDFLHFIFKRIISANHSRPTARYHKIVQDCVSGKLFRNSLFLGVSSTPIFTPLHKFWRVYSSVIFHSLFNFCPILSTFLSTDKNRFLNVFSSFTNQFTLIFHPQISFLFFSCNFFLFLVKLISIIYSAQLTQDKLYVNLEVGKYFKGSS